MFKVNLVQNGQSFEIKAKSKQNLLNLIRENGFQIDSPCGGNGTCGKCRVKILNGIVSEAGEKEKKHLYGGLNRNERLACCINVESDLTVELKESKKSAQIAVDSLNKELKVKPDIKKYTLKQEKLNLDDQRSLLTRVLEKTGLKAVNTGILNKLDRLRTAQSVNIIADKHKILDIGTKENRVFGAAFDIGTTTVAAYLYDLENGYRVSNASCLNSQKIHGADVISRINFAMTSENGRQILKKCVLNDINLLLRELCKKGEIEQKEIYKISITGNTTMLHLLLGIDASGIAAAPFIPVFTEKIALEASKEGIDINANGELIILPGVSSYVGADTVSAIIASGLDKRSKISLLLDIGTNGEMVLGCKDWLLGCSVAAGPAFEGANISCGTGSISGAIDKVSIDCKVKITTIDSEKPCGICGSGIVDSIAQLLKAGVIDFTGRLLNAEEFEGDPEIARRIFQGEKCTAFQIYEDQDLNIRLTQQDVREVQNAKAAVAAGIRLLVKEAGLNLKDIENVYLAGGFGSYMNIESSLKIGLLPKELEGKIKSIGNAAGLGASMCLLSSDELRHAEKVSKKVKYIELSGRPDFTDLYVESMIFGDEI